MQQFRLFLFGTMRLTLDEQTIEGFRSNKTRALLAYLALAHGQEIARSHLANLLWHGYTRATALTNLRAILVNLRQVLAPTQLLHTTPHSVRLQVDGTAQCAFWCDALTLDHWLALADKRDNPSQEILPALLDTALLEFLQELDEVDSEPFQDWRVGRQQHYQQQLIVARHHLSKTAHHLLHNLPRPLTPLIGRQQEIERLSERLLDPSHPLVVLTGEGGIGKTRLALAVAEQVKSQFGDGVWFVPLAGVPATPPVLDRLAAAIGEALKLTFGGATQLDQQLFAQLQHRQLLLILDNFEHLRDGVNLVCALLQQAPGVKVLVTSRHRLNLHGEVLIRLAGLPVPTHHEAETETASALLRYASIALFVERAHALDCDFQLERENQQQVAQICRLVAGLPLAIELAAAQLEHLTCAQIAAALPQDYTILETTASDLPWRHHSMESVLAYSWQFLTPEEAQAIANCSVFRGGFTLEAAETVAGATADLLRRLIQQSLLRKHPNGRFEMHELVRQFAAARLHADPVAEMMALEWHCFFYADLLYHSADRLAHDSALHHHLRLELDNFRFAWQCALETSDLLILERCLAGLFELYYLAGFYFEAATVAAETVQHVRNIMAASSQPTPEQKRVLTKLLVQQARFCTALARLPEARELLNEAQLFGELSTTTTLH